MTEIFLFCFQRGSDELLSQSGAVSNGAAMSPQPHHAADNNNDAKKVSLFMKSNTSKLSRGRRSLKPFQAHSHCLDITSFSEVYLLYSLKTGTGNVFSFYSPTADNRVATKVSDQLHPFIREGWRTRRTPMHDFFDALVCDESLVHISLAHTFRDTVIFVFLRPARCCLSFFISTHYNW